MFNAKFQRRIQRYGWDKAAQHYENGWRESLAGVQSRTIALAAAQPGEQVLDVACGTGLVTFPIASAVGDAGRVVAADISAEMVRMLQSEAEGAGIRNVDAIRADAEDLSVFEDDQFDLITCCLGLMYFPEPEVALREMLRVLKPGGRLVVSVWGARKNCGWAEIFPIVDARVQSQVCPMFFRLGTGEVMSMELAEAGFEGAVMERMRVSLPFSSADMAADAAFIGGPVALAYERFEDEVKASAREEYLRSIADYRDGDGYNIPGEFVLATAMKSAAGKISGAIEETVTTA